MHQVGWRHSTVLLVPISCVKCRYGKELIKVYERYKNAEILVAEMILEVRSVWLKSEAQMQLLSRIWNSLDETLQTHQLDCLRVLQQKLKQAVDEFDEIIGDRNAEADLRSILAKRGSLKKGRFAFRAHKHLEEMISSLGKWHQHFDLSWWLTLRVPTWDNLIDEELEATRRCFEHHEGKALHNMQNLRKAMYDPPSEMDLHPQLVEQRMRSNSRNGQATIVPSPFPRDGSSIFVLDLNAGSPELHIKHSSCTRANTEDGQPIVVDAVRPDERVRPRSLLQSVRDLGRVLSKVDSATFGLMTCLGVVKVYKDSHHDSDNDLVGFDFIFAIPPSLDTSRSLRDVLLSDTSQVPLNEWFDLAKQLARSVFFIHTANFVHKNIRPETILCFKTKNSKLGRSFLVGFEKFRLEGGLTYHFGDDLWEENIYRHPQRQGLYPEEYYLMQHDIYSLGVVLLEIGLRTSFVVFPDAEGSSSQGFYPNDCLINEKNTESESGFSNFAEILSPLKDQLCLLAEDALPALMGVKYSQVVLSCLKCLDEGNEGFGDQSQFQDKDGILVAVRYIEKVCRHDFLLISVLTSVGFDRA